MQYNLLEQREMICSVSALFITFVFVNNEVSLAVNYTLLFLLFLTVYWFGSCWLFLVYSKSVPHRVKLRAVVWILAKVSFMKVDEKG